jgi:arginine/ornithine N-succinyltransferase beta subunit
VRDSKHYTITVEDVEGNAATSDTPYLVSNTSLTGYRCTMVYINVPESGPLCISTELATALQVSTGDQLRAVPLFGPRL